MNLDHTLASIAGLRHFDAIIDARSPSEFAHDHLPGAINCPVLNDEERARVGTLYKQVSPFEARKVGAALVAINVANHIQAQFATHPRGWTPLIYCWRGGQRSGAFSHILRQVGWPAQRLEGGYKAWRSFVMAELAQMPEQFHFEVVSGPTGCAKTKILHALAEQGEQVLDLEGLAAHKGSVLGELPTTPQPSQKMFDTLLLDQLTRLDPARTVYVEAESKRIGQIQLPDALFEVMNKSPWLSVSASLQARVDFLLTDYAYWLDDPQLLTHLDRLKPNCGNEQVVHWQSLVTQREFARLVSELLTQHYDHFYKRSLRHAQSGAPEARMFSTDDLSPQSITELAQRIVQSPALSAV
jgi:tRNA 2-selenouridine synthase